MDKTKKVRAVEIIRDEKNPTVPQSVTKEQYQALLDAYKAKNPVKYAQKESALLARLAAL